MARQLYCCPEHGEFEIVVSIKDYVFKVALCPTRISHPRKQGCKTLCHRDSPWVPSVPNFIGGPTTGAQKE